MIETKMEPLAANFAVIEQSMHEEAKPPRSKPRTNRKLRRSPSISRRSNARRIRILFPTRGLETGLERNSFDGTSDAADGYAISQEIDAVIDRRRGTEWAMTTHSSNERFVLPAADTAKSLDTPGSAIGGAMELLATGLEDSGVFSLWAGSEWRDGEQLCDALVIAGQTVVREQQAAVSNVSGGAVIDGEARSTITSILEALRVHGLIAT